MFEAISLTFSSTPLLLPSLVCVTYLPLDAATLPHWQNDSYLKYSASRLLTMTSLAASDNVILGRGLRPSSLSGGPPRGRSAQTLSCAVWLHHAATVTSYVRMRSSSVGLALVARARDLGRRRSAAQSWRSATREGQSPAGSWAAGSAGPPNNGHAHQPTCYITVCNVSAPLQWWGRWLEDCYFVRTH